jgi:hypothetical protein
MLRVVAAFGSDVLTMDDEQFLGQLQRCGRLYSAEQASATNGHVLPCHRFYSSVERRRSISPIADPIAASWIHSACAVFL